MFIVTITNLNTLEVLEAPFARKIDAMRAANAALFIAPEYAMIEVFHNGENIF